MDYQLLAIAVFLAAFFAMKALALMVSGTDWTFLYRSPVFAPFSEKRALRKNRSSVKRLKERFIFLAIANIVLIEAYQFLFAQYSFSQVLKAWLFAPYLYFFTNLLGTSAQCLGLLTKEIPADIHNHPYLSKGLSEFWAKRWNVWVGDWLAVVSRKLSVRPGSFRLFTAFALSGFFHELIIALPYYLSSGKNYFGLMTTFFMLQFLFVLLDKKLFVAAGKLPRKLFLWFSLLAPMPLFVNPSTLAFFGF